MARLHQVRFRLVEEPPLAEPQATREGGRGILGRLLLRGNRRFRNERAVLLAPMGGIMLIYSRESAARMYLGAPSKRGKSSPRKGVQIPPRPTEIFEKNHLISRW